MEGGGGDRGRGRVGSRRDDDKPKTVDVPCKLPEQMMPFAERFFSWFPEVVVCLGQPDLEELFELQGAELRLEDHGDHKLVLVRLRRRRRARHGIDGRRGTKKGLPIPAPQRTASLELSAFASGKAETTKSVCCQEPIGTSASAVVRAALFGAEPGRAEKAETLLRAAPRQAERRCGDVRTAFAAAAGDAELDGASAAAHDEGGRAGRGTSSADCGRPPSGAGATDSLLRLLSPSAVAAASPAMVAARTTHLTPAVASTAPATPATLAANTGVAAMAEGPGLNSEQAACDERITRSAGHGLATDRQPTQPRPATGKTLQERRKYLNLSGLPELQKQDANHTSAPSNGARLEDLRQQPVLSTTNLRGPFPGAFPHRRTLIAFDWDDTLCPTSWIKTLLNDHIEDKADWQLPLSGCKAPKGLDFDWRYNIPKWFGQPLPDLPDVQESMNRLQDAIIHVIRTAQDFGVVVIVTNAVNGWVEKTTRRWLPRLTEWLFGHGTRPGIHVLYAQEEYKKSEGGNDRADLAWVDRMGELMAWKKAAMAAALVKIDDLYRVMPRSASNKTRGRSRSPTAQTLDRGCGNDATHDTTGNRARGGTEETIPCLPGMAHPGHVPSTGQAAIGVTADGAAQPAALVARPGALVEATAVASSEPSLRTVPWQADSCAKGLINFLSIGDTEAEAEAAWLAVLEHQAVGLGCGSLTENASPADAIREAVGTTTPVEGDADEATDTSSKPAASTARRRRQGRCLSTPPGPHPLSDSGPIAVDACPRDELSWGPCGAGTSVAGVGQRPQGSGPWVKVLKMSEVPTVGDLVEQLQVLARKLPYLVAARSHLRLTSEDLMGDVIGHSSRAEVRQLLSLRTQTV